MDDPAPASLDCFAHQSSLIDRRNERGTQKERRGAAVTPGSEGWSQFDSAGCEQTLPEFKFECLQRLAQ